jgi:hypothetical protein
MMRNLIRLAALAAVLAPPRAHAAFQQGVVTPRAQALGGSMLASEGSAALFLNPASIQSPSRDLYFMYHQMLTGVQGVAGLSQGFAAAATPTPLGMVAAGVGNFTAAGLEREQSYALAAAHAMTDKLVVGAAAKYLWHGFSVGGDPLAATDPTFAQRTSRGAFAADLGLVYRPAAALQLGLVARNVNAPDVGLAVVDRIPRQFGAGLAYDSVRLGLRTLVDVRYSDADPGLASQRLVPSLGLEKYLENGRFRFRVGASPQAMSAGFGVRFDKFGLDYAFVFERGLPDGSGSHSVGLSVAF